MSLDLKKQKIFLKVVPILLVSLILGYFTFKEFSTTEYIDEQVETPLYKISPNLEIRFNLIPSEIYEDDYLGSDRMIISSLVQDVSITGNITVETFESDNADFALVNYEKLITTYGENEELLWEKKSNQVTRKYSGESSYKIPINWTIDINSYKEFLSYAYETTEISGNTVVTAIWELNGVIQMLEGDVDINKKIEVSIPIDASVFMLDGSSLNQVEENITKTVQIEADKNMVKAFIMLGITIVSFVAAIVYLVISRGVKSKSEYEIKKDHIFKEYGDRLARLEKTISCSGMNLTTVMNIEDMVKISDEIRQPIFYFHVDEEDEKKMEFFVFDGPRTYYMSIIELASLDIEEFISSVK